MLIIRSLIVALLTSKNYLWATLVTSELLPPTPLITFTAPLWEPSLCRALCRQFVKDSKDPRQGYALSLTPYDALGKGPGPRIKAISKLNLNF